MRITWGSVRKWGSHKSIIAMDKKGCSAVMRDQMGQILVPYPTGTRGDESPEGQILLTKIEGALGTTGNLIFILKDLSIKGYIIAGFMDKYFSCSYSNCMALDYIHQVSPSSGYYLTGSTDYTMI